MFRKSAFRNQEAGERRQNLNAEKNGKKISMALNIIMNTHRKKNVPPFVLPKRTHTVPGKMFFVVF